MFRFRVYDIFRSLIVYAYIFWNLAYDLHSALYIESPAWFSESSPYKHRLDLMNSMKISSKRTLISACFTFDIISGTINVDAFSTKIIFTDQSRTRYTFLLKEYLMVVFFCLWAWWTYKQILSNIQHL